MAQTDMALTLIGQRNNPRASKAAGARFPKFVIRSGNTFSELRKAKGTSKSMIPVPLTI